MSERPTSQYAAVVFAGVLLAVIMLVWWRWSPGESAPTPRPAGGEVSHVDEETSASLRLAPPLDSDGAPRAREIVAITPTEKPIPTSEPPTVGPGELLLLVVDPDGSPVGNVPVELVITSSMHEGRLYGKSEALSDDAGYALLTECAVEMQAAFRPDEAQTMWTGLGLEVGVRSKLPFGDDDDRELVDWLRAEPPAGEPVLLVLPPLGWIQLEIQAMRDSAGTLLLPERVLVRRADSGFFPGWRQGIPLDGQVTSHRLGPFGLGWEISLNLTRGRQIGALANERVPGPTVAGEVLPVTIRTGGGRGITGIALLPDGEPLIDARLHLRLEGPAPRGASTTRVATDAEGRWSAWLPNECESATLVLARSSDPLEHRARVDLARLVAGATSLDLGAIVLYPTKPPARRLADGLVVASSGEPVARATVTVYEVTADGVANHSFESTRTHRDGRYDLDSATPVPSGLIQLHISHPEYLPTDGVEVPVGSAGLVHELLRGASVNFLAQTEGSLLHLTQLLVRLQGPTSSRHLALGDVSTDRETRRQRFTGLAAGDYHFAIEIRKTNWVLFATDLTLAAGGIAELGDIDLVGRTQELRLTVVDQDGEPVADERFQIVGDDRLGYDSVTTDRHGAIYCLLPADASALHFYSRKFGDHPIAPGADPIQVVVSR
jgi:hypothetical protein